jgi:methionine-rich copper-binding protein CopC
MRKTILTILSASVIAALTAQTAVAAEHHHARKTTPASEQFRNSNAYAAPANIESELSHYSGGFSAPAGR